MDGCGSVSYNRGMKTKSIFAASLVLGSSVLFAAQSTKDVPVVKLVDNAQVRFHTVVADDAPAPLRKGAAELVKYLDGGTPAPGERTIPIEIRVEELPELVKDGFVLDVKTDGIVITGWNARGALYGCYEILRKHAGMRWLVPGLNGEYRVGDWKNVSVPVGRRVCNPHLAQRTMSACSRLSAEWQARNNMASVAWGIGRRKYEDWMDDFATEGVCNGGHCMAQLILGDVPKGMSNKEWGEKLCREHPEWHALIDGQRQPCYHDGRSPNPCVSNPATLDHMAENLIKWLKASPHSCEAPVILGNNDTTAWCQCENCRKLDPPETKGTRGELSDRYWYMVNGLAERVWKEVPRANLGGWCYQNFWYAPVRVKPNPNLSIIVSFNNQCWRHTCLDPKCAVNREMANIYAGWKKLGMKYVFNRDEIAAGGSPGAEFEPSESVCARNFLEYRELGCNGSCYCLGHDDEPFFAWAEHRGNYKGRNYSWAAMWQCQYIASLMMWDPTVDWQAALEEANRLYYGDAAWKGGMKEFRALLTDCFLSAPGCIGWGQGANTGPCLDRPGLEKKLVKLLDRAVYFAWRSGDGRAIRHVELEREIFQLTWLKTRADYVLNHREMEAFAATDPIKADGVLGEKTWQDAVAFTNFATARWSQEKEDVKKTKVRIAYDDDNLYFAVEAMEPTPEKMVSAADVDGTSGGFARLGNHLELFYSYPDMGEATYHLMVNDKGGMIDMITRSSAVHDDSFKTKAKWATRVCADRWILEIAIPFSEIGQKVMSGSVWKVNVGRERQTKDDKSETSTMMAGGQFFGTSCYVNVRFVPSRK